MTEVQSPAGETIQIIPDEEWLQLAGRDAKGLRAWNGSKPAVARALWEHGAFTSKGGHATADLLDYMRSNYPNAVLPKQSPSLSMMMLDPLNALAFRRETNGKRTKLIQLVALPDSWYRKLLRDIGPVKQEAPAAPVVQEDPQEAPTAPEAATDDLPDFPLPAEAWVLPGPTLEVEIASQVAMSLLTTVVEIISTGPGDAAGLKRLRDDLAQSQHLLAQRLEENGKLRKQLRESQDMNAALTHERNGLRERLRMTEANLTEILKGETAQAVNAEIQKRIDKLMRTAPTSSKGE